MKTAKPIEAAFERLAKASGQCDDVFIDIHGQAVSLCFPEFQNSGFPVFAKRINRLVNRDAGLEAASALLESAQCHCVEKLPDRHGAEVMERASNYRPDFLILDP